MIVSSEGDLWRRIRVYGAGGWEGGEGRSKARSKAGKDVAGEISRCGHTGRGLLYVRKAVHGAGKGEAGLIELRNGGGGGFGRRMGGGLGYERNGDVGFDRHVRCGLKRLGVYC